MSNNKLPFGVDSLLPSLKDVPRVIYKHVLPEPEAPAFLRLSESARMTINTHIRTVGLDSRRFDYNVKSQSKVLYFYDRYHETDSVVSDQALELFSDLELYIPGRDERDVQTKLAIQKTKSSFVIGKGPGKEKERWKRWTRTYQCQCGIDHTTGRRTAEKKADPLEKCGLLNLD
jgi:hypothetical protein